MSCGLEMIALTHHKYNYPLCFSWYILHTYHINIDTELHRRLAETAQLSHHLAKILLLIVILS